MKFRTYRTYWLAVLVCLIIAAVPVSLSYLYLVRTSELVSGSEVASIQEKEKLLYGARFSSGGGSVPYKIEQIKVRRPRVLALGSSRVMNLTQQSFSVPFFNGGGALSNASDLRKFYRTFKSDLKEIDLILVQIDYWWFNRFIVKDRPYSNSDDLDSRKLLAPLKAIFKSKITIKEFFNAIGDPATLSYHSGYDIKTVGKSATEDGFGYLADGSIVYPYESITNVTDPGAIGYRNSYNMHKHDFRTYNGRSLRSYQLSIFKKTIEEIKKDGKKVIIMIPPVSHSVYKNIYLDSREVTFFNAFNNYVDDLSKIVPVFNFHSPIVLGGDECEFVDGFHGGHVTGMRSILKMSNKNLILAKLVNLEKIKDLIEKFQGRTFVNGNGPRLSVAEIDFLDLGCRKSNAI